MSFFNLSGYVSELTQSLHQAVAEDDYYWHIYNYVCGTLYMSSLQVAFHI